MISSLLFAIVSAQGGIEYDPCLTTIEADAEIGGVLASCGIDYLPGVFNMRKRNALELYTGTLAELCTDSCLAQHPQFFGIIQKYDACMNYPLFPKPDATAFSAYMCKKEGNDFCLLKFEQDISGLGEAETKRINHCTPCGKHKLEHDLSIETDSTREASRKAAEDYINQTCPETVDPDTTTVDPKAVDPLTL
jgi:hypothetical protein